MSEIALNDSFEILTPSGWGSFSGIKRDIKQTCLITFTKSQFECTLNHVFVDDGKEIRASSLKPGDSLCGRIVVSVKLHRTIDVYDPIDVENGNLYYSDGLVSHNCKFLGSSLTLINAETIGNMSIATAVFSKDGLDLYETSKPGHSYVLIADTAKGVGGDYSAFAIVDITEVPYKLVGKYRNNDISPLLYPNVIAHIGKQFNNAWVLVETNFSEQVPYILHNELEYENLLFVNRSNSMQTVTGGFGGGQTQLGVTTDKKVKRTGCHNFKALVEENKLIIQDADTISEISTFIEKNGSFKADDGYNDDLVMALVLFSWLTSTPYFKDLNNINLRELMYDKRIKAMEDELTPFGFFDDGQDKVETLLNF